MSQTVTGSIQQSIKNWELTPYELQRTPQEVITDNTEIAVSPRSLHNELMCPICLDMLRNTMTTKECLHRFCSECITTALRSGNKECPTCRKKLVSRRSLRPDPNFDSLISKIYPSRDEYEAHQERMLHSLTKHHNGNALCASIEEGLKTQAMSRLQKIRKHDNAMAAKTCDAANALIRKSASKHPLSSADSPKGGTADSGQPPASKKIHLAEKEGGSKATVSEEKIEDKVGKSIATEDATVPSTSNPPASAKSGEVTTDSDDSLDMSSVEMIFKPHPDQTGSSSETATRYIKTSTHATVNHMAEFIKVRINLENKSSDPKDVSKDPTVSANEYDIYVYTMDTYQPLNGDMSLDSVQDLYWKKDNPLEVFYLKK